MTLPIGSDRNDLDSRLRRHIDMKTKPPGSLGRIEDLALQIGRLQQTRWPRMRVCRLTIFAADHGIATTGVSAYPQEVTRQMVLNFLAEGAAANAFARALGVEVNVVDAGVAGDPIDAPGLTQQRIAAGTANSLEGPAMTASQYATAFAAGQSIGSADDADALCFGEMGIGNTSAAALVCHKLLGLSLEELVGRGTGVDDDGLRRKAELLSRAAARTAGELSAKDAMREYGGFEMAMMSGAMLAAVAAGKLVIVDGFIATAAAAVALGIDGDCRRGLVFAHLSAERGHRAVVQALSIRPYLELGMRLGEGTGALLAWPLVQCAAAMMNDMASFDSAGVSGPA